MYVVNYTYRECSHILNDLEFFCVLNLNEKKNLWQQFGIGFIYRQNHEKYYKQFIEDYLSVRYEDK